MIIMNFSTFDLARLGTSGIHCGCNRIDRADLQYTIGPDGPSCFQCFSTENKAFEQVIWFINGEVVAQDNDLQVQSTGVLSVLNPQAVFNTQPTDVHCLESATNLIFRFTVALGGKVKDRHNYSFAQLNHKSFYF